MQNPASHENAFLLAIAASAAATAATLWWMFIDQISLSQALRSPFPYALFLLSWFVGIPMYVFVSHRLGRGFWLLQLLASLGAAPFAIFAMEIFLTPRDFFAVFLIFSTSWVATTTFWVVLKFGSMSQLD